MWGKWAQKQNKNHTTLVTQEKEFYKLLTCPGTEVRNIIFPNDEVALISWKYIEDNVASGKNENVVVAAYVITQARLKLYEYARVGGVCADCDTDSIIYIHKLDEAHKLQRGDYVDDLTDELEEFGSGSFIQESVSGGYKNYGFSVICSAKGKNKTKYKVKCITLNYNSKVENHLFEQDDSGRRHPIACPQSLKDQKETWCSRL
jgi:hypothetical protein